MARSMVHLSWRPFGHLAPNYAYNPPGVGESLCCRRWVSPVVRDILPPVWGPGVQDRLPGHPRLSRWRWPRHGKTGIALSTVDYFTLNFISTRIVLCVVLERKFGWQNLPSVVQRTKIKFWISWRWTKLFSVNFMSERVPGNHSQTGGSRVRLPLLLVHHPLQREELHWRLVSGLRQQSFPDWQLRAFKPWKTLWFIVNRDFKNLRINIPNIYLHSPPSHSCF